MHWCTAPSVYGQCQQKEQLGCMHNKKPATRGQAGPLNRIQYPWDQQGSMEILSAGSRHTSCSYVEHVLLIRRTRSILRHKSTWRISMAKVRASYNQLTASTSRTFLKMNNWAGAKLTSPGLLPAAKPQHHYQASSKLSTVLKK